MLPPGAAIVVYGDTASEGSLSLGNSGDSVILADATGTVVAELTYTGALADRDGVSMVRVVEGDPESALVLHDTVSSEPSSPGEPTTEGAW